LAVRAASVLDACGVAERTKALSSGRGSPKRGRGRPRIPKEVQRQRLVDATLRAIGQAHYEKISVADIVREAGMSSRSFYDHFVSKEDVVAEIVREQGRRLIATLEGIYRETKDEGERADRALQAYLELFPAGTIDLERLGGEAGQRVREVRQSYVEVITDMVLQQFQRALERGVAARVPAREAVAMVLMGIEGLSFRYYSEGRRDELLKLQPVLLRVFLRALS
jgi:AcrR family transcriptional regulator